MFNSLKYAKQLIEAGATPELADIQTQMMADLVEFELNSVKQDIGTVKQDIKDLKSEMALGFKSMDVRFAELEMRLVRNLTGIMAALMTAAVAFNKLL